MKNFNKLLILILISVFTFSCESEDEIYEKSNPNLSVISFTRKMNIASVSENNNTFNLEVVTTKAFTTDKTFEIVLNTEESSPDANEYSLESTSVTIPAGETVGYANFTFDFDSMVAGLSKRLVYELEVPDDVLGDDVLVETTLKYSRPCEANLLTLDIIWLDKWSSETSWEVLDSSNTVVSSNAYADSTDGMEVSELICLEAGDYTFNFYDSYGDGLAAGGSFELKIGSTILASGGGNFGSLISTPFTIE